MIKKVLHEQTNRNVTIGTTNLPIEGNHRSIKKLLISLPYKEKQVKTLTIPLKTLQMKFYCKLLSQKLFTKEPN